MTAKYILCMYTMYNLPSSPGPPCMSALCMDHFGIFCFHCLCEKRDDFLNPVIGLH